MKTVTIKTEKNGFSASPDYYGGAAMAKDPDVWVFQTFEALTEWLKKNLDDNTKKVMS